MTDSILDELNAMKPALLAQLQTRDRQTGGLAHDILAHDIHIRPVAQQGSLNRTYQCDVGKNTFILSVRLPIEQHEHTRPRSTMTDRRSFQHRLEMHAVPTAQLVGEPFLLPHHGHSCEFMKFVNAYQLPPGTPLSDSERDSLAETTAQMHKAGANWMPLGKPRPHTVTATHLPSGFLHGDITRGNVLFDTNTHTVNAIIDFDYVHYGTFAEELGNMLRLHFTHFTIDTNAADPSGFTFDNDGAKKFLDAYSAIRPISAAEIPAIRTALEKSIAKELYYTNLAKGSPLSEDQLAELRTPLEQKARESFDYTPAQPAKTSAQR